MGNKIKNSKAIDLIILGISIAVFIYFFFPATHGFLSAYKIEYYDYKPSAPVRSLVDTAALPPAKAVPILMYHGVVEKDDGINTSIANFTDQMEMLKREGYETVTLRDYDLFRQGQYTLPPKPIVITFDDGRKDSYYTTDDIFKELGFKATIFVATEKALDGETFYLNWNDLKAMRDSGRWEIQAHGRRSHEKIPVSARSIEDEYGRYLTSRMYLASERRLETVAEFERRVEQDYVDNINDLQVNLGLNVSYLAIPLNDYGLTPLVNNPEAAQFNRNIIKKYFRLAFIQANGTGPSEVVLPVYNYKNDDPFSLRRIEVIEMSTTTLKSILDREVPTNPNIDLQISNPDGFLKSSSLKYGYMTIDNSGLRIKTLAPNSTAKVQFGDLYWENYEISVEMERKVGRSIYLSLYTKDEKNYFAYGLTDNGLFLRQKIDGVDHDLRPSVITDASERQGYHTYRVVWKNGQITAYFDGQPIFVNVPIARAEGSIGVKVWSDKEIAEGSVRSIRITPPPALPKAA